MSRWTMPCLCAEVSASATVEAMRSASSTGSCCSRASLVRSDSPRGTPSRTRAGRSHPAGAARRNRGSARCWDAGAGGDAHFADEPVHADRAGQFRVEYLDRDGAIVLDVPRQPDHGHPAPPELALEAVAVSDERLGAYVHRGLPAGSRCVLRISATRNLARPRRGTIRGERDKTGGPGGPAHRGGLESAHQGAPPLEAQPPEDGPHRVAGGAGGRQDGRAEPGTDRRDVRQRRRPATPRGPSNRGARGPNAARQAPSRHPAARRPASAGAGERGRRAPSACWRTSWSSP